MGWGSMNTTVSTASTSNTATPNLNPLAQNEYSNVLFPQANALVANANKPTYGDAQKADVLNNLNDLANSASKHLKSTLASTGQLNSGSDVVGQTGIEQQRLGNLSSFYTNLPAMEDQSHQQKMSAALGLAGGLTGQLPVGQTSQGTSDGTQTQTSSPGFGSILGGMLGSMMGGLGGGLTGGLGSMMGGGSFGSGFSNTMNPMGQFNMQVPYGGMNFSPPMQSWQSTQPVN